MKGTPFSPNVTQMVITLGQTKATSENERLTLGATSWAIADSFLSWWMICILMGLNPRITIWGVHVPKSHCLCPIHHWPPAPWKQDTLGRRNPKRAVSGCNRCGVHVHKAHEALGSPQSRNTPYPSHYLPFKET